MQRYFCNEKNENKFILSSDDSYHIKKVMRMKIGDNIEIINNKILYICEIIDLNNLVIALIKKELDTYNEMDKKIILCQSLVNEQKMDLILQKGVELGIYEFIPFKAKNSVVKENDKSSKKVERWQRIVKEASEQSKRNIIPIVNKPITLNELKNVKYDLKLICSVNELTMSLKKVIQDNKSYDTMIIVIGPEGGFDPKEEKELIESGFISVSLGSRVLRTETASIVALSYINYELER